MTVVTRTAIVAMHVTTEVVVPLEDTVEDTVEDTGSTSKRWVLFGSSCPKAGNRLLLSSRRAVHCDSGQYLQPD